MYNNPIMVDPTDMQPQANSGQTKDHQIIHTTQISNNVKLKTVTTKHGPFKTTQSYKVFTPDSPELNTFLTNRGATPETLTRIKATNFLDEFKDADGNIVFRAKVVGNQDSPHASTDNNTSSNSIMRIFAIIGLSFLIILLGSIFFTVFASAPEPIRSL